MDWNVVAELILIFIAEVNRRDFRAWYGLGQAYEILKMPFYSLHYYKAAQQLRPYDSRMLVALGETYEKLDKGDNALKCYQKAYNVGDIEGVALYNLARLYEKRDEIEKAIPALLRFCSDEKAVADKSSLCHAYMTLGNFYEKNDQFDKASHFAYKCLEHEETKREAEALLKTIANKRSLKAAATAAASASASAKEPAASTGKENTTDMDLEEVEMDESNVGRMVDMVMAQDDMLVENDEPEFQLEQAVDDISSLSIIMEHGSEEN